MIYLIFFLQSVAVMRTNIIYNIIYIYIFLNQFNKNLLYYQYYSQVQSLIVEARQFIVVMETYVYFEKKFLHMYLF